jgi:hypothetical protein
VRLRGGGGAEVGEDLLARDSGAEESLGRRAAQQLSIRRHAQSRWRKAQQDGLRFTHTAKKDHSEKQASAEGPISIIRDAVREIRYGIPRVI